MGGGATRNAAPPPPGHEEAAQRASNAMNLPLRSYQISLRGPGYPVTRPRVRSAAAEPGLVQSPRDPGTGSDPVGNSWGEGPLGASPGLWPALALAWAKARKGSGKGQGSHGPQPTAVLLGPLARAKCPSWACPALGPWGGLEREGAPVGQGRDQACWGSQRIEAQAKFRPKGGAQTPPPPPWAGTPGCPGPWGPVWAGPA